MVQQEVAGYRGSQEVAGEDMHKAFLLWSFVHGLAFLTIDGKLAEKKLDVDLEQVLREVALRVMEPLPG